MSTRPVRYPCQLCWRDCETPAAKDRGTCRFCQRGIDRFQ